MGILKFPLQYPHVSLQRSLKIFLSYPPGCRYKGPRRHQDLVSAVQ